MSRILRPYLSLPACHSPPANSFRSLEVLGRVWHTKGVSRPHKGLLFFFVLWCPTLQNHAVTAYAALFAEFEKMPVSCGFLGAAYDMICHLLMADLAVLEIKNS